MKVSMANVKTYLKNDKERMEWEYSLWRIVRGYAATKEGKNYDKRFIDGLRKVIEETYGADNVRWVSYSDCASMRSIEIEFKDAFKPHFRDSFRYFVSYMDSEGKEVNLASMDDKNQCWELDKGRALDVGQLLQAEQHRILASKAAALNKALKDMADTLEEVASYPKYDSWKFDFKRQFLNQDIISALQMYKN